LIFESVLISLTGGILGCGLAWCAVRALVALAPAGLPRIGEIALDFRVLAIALIASGATGIFFGLVPALTLARVNLVETLHSRANQRNSRRSASQSAVVIVEISICFMLLIGSALFVQSLIRLSAVDPGFDPYNLLAVQIELPQREYERTQLSSLYRRLADGLTSVPGVRAATATNGAPFEDFRSVDAITINGTPAVIERRYIWPNYFEVLGGRISEGRTFTEAELNGNPEVLIVNEAMARRFWPGESAVGKSVEFVANSRVPIVGVSRDVKQLGLTVTAVPMLYHPMSAATRFTFLIRTAQNAVGAATVVRARIRAIDANIAVNGTQPMDDLISASFAEQRYRTLLITIFAVSAVCLALVGLYGVISRSVAYRNRELGIRLAIGAEPRTVLMLILRQGVVLTSIGILAGGLSASWLAHVVSDYLFGITALDPSTYAGVAAILVVVSLAAVYRPARRASKIDPVECLRSE
jgi:putative ABC transport system permease protein